MADEKKFNDFSNHPNSGFPPPDGGSSQEISDSLKNLNHGIETDDYKPAFLRREQHEINREIVSYWIHRNGWKVFLCILLLLSLVGGILLGIRFFNQPKSEPIVEERLPSNVILAGIQADNLTREEAIQAIQNEIGDSYTTNDMVVLLGTDTIILPASNTRSSLNVEAMVDDAFRISQEQTEQEIILEPLPYLGLDNSYITAAIDLAVEGFSFPPTPPSYRVEGSMPPLGAEEFDESIPCQTLILTQGTPGTQLNADSIYNAVMDAYNRRVFSVSITFPVLPETLDLEPIHKALTIAPVDSVQDPDTLDITYGSCGYTFNLEEAKEKLAQTAHGKSVSIPMEYVLPEVLKIPMEYPVKLASYSSPLSSNTAYNENIALACQTLDGLVLQPGEIFSVKENMPALTEANGFQFAPAHAEYCQSESRGGGMDQLTSTLHVAAICADLNIIQRNSPHHVCPYTILGTEVSTIAEKMDFRFENNQDSPIQLRARLVGDEVMVSIWGKEKRDYYCKVDYKSTDAKGFLIYEVDKAPGEGYENGDVIREGINGCWVNVFRVYYDLATDQEIRSVNEYTVYLKPVDRITAKVAS